MQLPKVQVSGSLNDVLSDIVPQTPCVEICPHKIIVAWQGVLTLSFDAWPNPLVDIKRWISDLPEFSNTSENFGTRWPKVTLAALDDGAPPMTLYQLRDLTALCREFDDDLQKIGPITLTHCSAVMFASRSLNKLLCRVDYAFIEQQNEQEYDADSYDIVREVIRETEQLDEYLSKVNAPGHRWGPN